MNAITGNNFNIQQTGLEFRGELTREEWDDLGAKLGQIGKSIGFIIGDWINYGEKRWGEMYAEAERITGMPYQTLANFSYVARRVQFSCRQEKLGFEHHAVVAKLKAPEDQQHWLESAMKHKLSVRRLRVSMNKGHVVSIDEMDVDPADRGMPTYMTWLNKLLHWWTKRTQDDPIDQWDALDRARLKRDLEPWIKIYEQL
ncbi:MAG: hypothetical protein ACFUZC_10030 [Chthoniobacteraceae bacterium]